MMTNNQGPLRRIVACVVEREVWALHETGFALTAHANHSIELDRGCGSRQPMPINYSVMPWLIGASSLLGSVKNL
jgi:hypothetical protein